jgi:hypothetical protein
MKNLILIITSVIFFSACASTKETRLAKAADKKAAEILNREAVKKAVEAKKYIIRFDRMYYSYGGYAMLVPTSNYIIIDGQNAVINTAYLGRQYDIRPIVAINLRGKWENYVSKNNPEKGIYNINMKVKNNNSARIDLMLEIGADGDCTVSIASLKTDFINYRGNLIPMIENEEMKGKEKFNI